MNETNRNRWDGSGAGRVAFEGGNQMYIHEAEFDEQKILDYHNRITKAKAEVTRITGLLETCSDTLTEEERAQMMKDIEIYESIVADSTVELDDYMRHIPGADDDVDAKAELI